MASDLVARIVGEFAESARVVAQVESCDVHGHKQQTLNPS